MMPFERIWRVHSDLVPPLLVQDVESYDPILNPVLNREVRRTGGRVLITLGDQDIDLSPSFTVFLSTRDPTVCVRCCLLHCFHLLQYCQQCIIMYITANVWLAC